MEDGVGHERLHWHHLTPQHTGHSSHSEGILLCRRCHHMVHRSHKVVGTDGYSQAGLPLPQRKSVKRRKTEAQQLTEAWAT